MNAGRKVVTLNHDRCLEYSQRMREPNGLRIEDRRYFFKVYTKSFLGSEAVDFLVKECALTPEEAINVGQNLLDNKIIRESDQTEDGQSKQAFQDGRTFYRFQEDEYTSVLNRKKLVQHDIVLHPCDVVAPLLSRMQKVLANLSIASIFLHQIDIQRIKESEEFKKVVVDISDLQKIDIKDLPETDKLVFWVNVYNLLALHAAVELGMSAAKSQYLNDPAYLIQNNIYCLNDIKHGILRANMPEPQFLAKPRFSDCDMRAIHAMERINPAIHLMLTTNTKSSPPVPVLHCESPEEQIAELVKSNCREFVTVLPGQLILPKLLSTYKNDFGREDNQLWSYFKNYLSVDQQATLNPKPQIKFADDSNQTFCFPQFLNSQTPK